MSAPRELFVLIEDDGDPYRAFIGETDAAHRCGRSPGRQVRRYVLADDGFPFAPRLTPAEVGES